MEIRVCEKLFQLCYLTEFLAEIDTQFCVVIYSLLKFPILEDRTNQASHPIPRHRGIRKGAETRSEVRDRVSACPARSSSPNSLDYSLLHKGESVVI